MKDISVDRYLPIRVSPFEAMAIAIKLKGVKVKRPFTHDLLKMLIDRLEAKVSHILINDLVNNVFYARIIMDVANRHIEIDSRPSDAIALAVRMKVPILVDEAVMKRAAVTPKPESKKISAEQEGKLDIFRDFVNSLDLDDL